jgi:hypothetical protein
MPKEQRANLLEHREYIHVIPTAGFPSISVQNNPQNRSSFMRKIVSKFALAVGLVLAMVFTLSCSSSDLDDNPGGSGSSSSFDGGGSSSSQSLQPLSSSNEPPPPSSSSSVAIGPIETIYVAEIGTVCVGFANSLPIQPIDNTYMVSNGTTAYVNMNSMCGDRSQYYTTGNSTYVTSWLNGFNISNVIRNSINQELFINGNSAYLGFYAAVDGYLRYLYVELVGDGKGLAKSVPEQQNGTAEAQ